MSHQVNPRNYTKVLVALLILTIITVGLSQVPLGRAGNIIIGVLVAVIKASLVVLFFMHLKYEQRWWAGIVLFPLTLVMIILFSNFADTALNGPDRGEVLGAGMTTKAELKIKHAGQPEAKLEPVSAPH